MTVENAGILLNGLLDVRSRSQLAGWKTSESHQRLLPASQKLPQAAGEWRNEDVDPEVRHGVAMVTSVDTIH